MCAAFDFPPVARLNCTFSHKTRTQFSQICLMPSVVMHKKLIIKTHSYFFTTSVQQQTFCIARVGIKLIKSFLA